MKSTPGHGPSARVSRTLSGEPSPSRSTSAGTAPAWRTATFDWAWVQPASASGACVGGTEGCSPHPESSMPTAARVTISVRVMRMGRDGPDRGSMRLSLW